MASPRAFSPLGAVANVTAPLGSSSASTPIPGVGGFSALVFNQATVPVTITFSGTSGGAVAAANGMTVGPGLTEVFSIPFGTVDCAVWGIGGTGTVTVQRGDGI